MSIHPNGWQQLQDIFGARDVHVPPLQCKVLDAIFGGGRKLWDSVS
jgi:hypothetical protein